LVNKINKHYAGNIKGKTFALWGLAFKPKTDDMREAPSRVVIEALIDAGAKVQAFDPEAMEETARIYGDKEGLQLVNSVDETLNNADALIVVTEWKNFMSPDFDLLKEKLADSVIFDGRNLYQPEVLEEKGIAYYAIGRGR